MALRKIRTMLIVFLVSLCIYLPIGYLGYLKSIGWELREENWRHSCIFIQGSAYSAIKNFGEVPQTIDELCELVSDYPVLSELLQRRITYYDPNAWQDPKRIFFMQEGRDFYYVTFGNGSQAILRYWYGPFPHKITGQYEFLTLSSPSVVPEYWIRPMVFCIVVFGIIGILVCTVVSGIFLRTKQVKTTKANGDLNKSISVPSQEDRM